ncbi:MAG TPA: sulfotransferase domain-containing protein [Iamia sp.]|nr:sulfotransferase domain-containing protein [Iamia sp.]
MRRYGSERNERWEGFAHRPGDVVVSTRSKCGTTWVQMICLLLVHGPNLPAPLSELSPWLDWDVEPLDAVRARLAAQRHRRVLKTHTPLDGLPLHPDVTYVVVGRHPLDVAVSLHHHVANIDQVRSAELRGRPVAAPVEIMLTEWLDRWIDGGAAVLDDLDTLAGNVHHVADARRRRADGLDVVLLHYDELAADREGRMRALAAHLGIAVPEADWPALVAAAGFDAMRADPSATVPDRLGVLRDHGAFFRSGRSGEGVAACTPAQLARYRDRMATLAPPDLVAWLHDPAYPLAP